MAKIACIALVGAASLMTIAACAEERRTVMAPEAAAEGAEDLHASVVANAQGVTEESLVDLSLALAPMSAPAEPESVAARTEPAAPDLTIEEEGAMKEPEPGSPASKAKAVPLPGTNGQGPPRSASEAAERGDAGGVPKAVSPTAPAETANPLEDER